MNSDKTSTLQSQGGYPTGLIGYIIGLMMNKLHSAIYKTTLNKIALSPGSICLDLGCGGGKAIAFINRKFDCQKIYGLDHSKQMVKLAVKCNKPAVRNGKVEIRISPVCPLDFPDDYFDLITAFETIQFWPEIDRSLREIFAKLKPGGIILLANRLPEEGSKWHKFARIKSVNEYQTRLAAAGFQNILHDTTTARGWIIIKGIK